MKKRPRDLPGSFLNLNVMKDSKETKREKSESELWCELAQIALKHTLPEGIESTLNTAYFIDEAIKKGFKISKNEGGLHK